jgi:hypothetical protein
MGRARCRCVWFGTSSFMGAEDPRVVREEAQR